MFSCEFSLDCVVSFSIYQLFMNFIRYYPIAGLFFFVLYIWKKKYFERFRIQDKYPKADKIIREIKQSAVTLITFSVIGVSFFILGKTGILKLKVYKDPEMFGGVPYMIFSFIILTIFHETYFYFLHRLMHTKLFYPMIHKVHHESVNPSPIAAYHFHWIEGFFEAIYLPVFLIFVPMYFPVFLFHTFYAMILNVIWHSGYEFMPKGFTTHPVFKWISTSTHHNLHHQKFNGNYGLYFNFWDRVLGTNFENYETYFDNLAEKRKLEKLETEVVLEKAIT